MTRAPISVDGPWRAVDMGTDASRTKRALAAQNPVQIRIAQIGNRKRNSENDEQPDKNDLTARDARLAHPIPAMRVASPAVASKVATNQSFNLRISCLVVRSGIIAPQSAWLRLSIN